MKLTSPTLSRRMFLATTAIAATGLIVRPARADTLDDIRQKGVLTVGTGVMGSKPWIWKNEDGSLAGVGYDMGQYVIKKLGVPQAEVVAGGMETLIPRLKSQRRDL